VGLLVRDATTGVPGGAHLAPAVRLVRRTVDQAGLGAAERRANLGGAMALVPRWALAVDGAVCLVADDVVTTGATLAEAARVLRAAGAAHVTAAVIAATSRTHSCPIPRTSAAPMAPRSDVHRPEAPLWGGGAATSVRS
jgi:orotate phosphoribosyltransferase-like protein